MKPSIAATPGIAIQGRAIYSDIVGVSWFSGHRAVIGILDVELRYYEICHRQKLYSGAYPGHIVFTVVHGRQGHVAAHVGQRHFRPT